MLAMTRKRHPHPNPLPSRAREKYGESPEEDEGKRDRRVASLLAMTEKGGFPLI